MFSSAMEPPSPSTTRLTIDRRGELMQKTSGEQRIRVLVTANSAVGRAGLESILGFKLQGATLKIDPCVPRWWRDFEITYRRGRTTYHIKVENPHGFSHGVGSVELDGAVQSSDEIPLADDEQTHEVRVVMGEKVAKDEPATSESDRESAKPAT